MSLSTVTTNNGVAVDDSILPGDIVSVRNAYLGSREGLVVGSHVDYAGRQIVLVQLDPGEVYHAWYPTVTRVKRTLSQRPALQRARTIERRVYW